MAVRISRRLGWAERLCILAFALNFAALALTLSTRDGRRAVYQAVMPSAQAALSGNKTARLQTTDKRAIACNFPVAMSSVVSVTYTLLYGTDADPAGMQDGSPTIGSGTYNGVTVASGKVSVVIDPDGDSGDRNKNGYQVSIIAATASGEHYTCDGPLRIENEEVSL